MTVTSFIEHIKNLPNYHNQIVHIEHLPSREANYQGLDKPLHPALEAILTEKGSRALYVFPTKAPAQDQLRSLAELVSLLPTPVRSAQLRPIAQVWK